jgi:hypothetical protein
MGLFDFLKGKKKISTKSANFARLIKHFCSDSGIPLQTQLKITKAIANDFIDNKKREISNFIFMDINTAKAYLINKGLNELDAEILWNIIQTNRESFLSI